MNLLRLILEFLVRNVQTIQILFANVEHFQTLNLVWVGAIETENSPFKYRIFLASSVPSTRKISSSASMQAHFVKPGARSSWHMRDILVFNHVVSGYLVTWVANNGFFFFLVFVFKLKANNKVIFGEEFNLCNLWKFARIFRILLLVLELFTFFVASSSRSDVFTLHLFLPRQH